MSAKSAAVQAKPVAPEADRLVADVEATLVEKVLRISQREP
jgi:hypothetical protein